MTLSEFAKEMEWFVVVYGNPSHVQTPEHMERVIQLIYGELKKYCKKDTDWERMIDRAKSNAYAFPSLPNFLTSDSRKSKKQDPFRAII